MSSHGTPPTIRDVHPRASDLIEMPRIGIVELEDAETGSRVLLDTSHEPTRRTFWETAVRRQRERAQTLRTCGVDLVELRTDEPYLKPLIKFFRLREARH